MTGSESKFRKPLFHLLTSGLVTKLRLHKGVFSHDPGGGRGGTSFRGVCPGDHERPAGATPAQTSSLLTYSQAPILIFLGRASRNEVPETHLWARGSSRSAAQAASLRKPTKGGSTSSSRAPPPSSPFPARSILVLSRSSGG